MIQSKTIVSRMDKEHCNESVNSVCTAAVEKDLSSFDKLGNIQGEFHMEEPSPANVLTDLAFTTVIPPGDLIRIWEWNAVLPRPIDRCVHEIIEERAKLQATAPAVCAWDGELDYQRLNVLADQLADQLLAFGIRPGTDTIVPLCFEKSMWMVVAMLGVLKAGAAFVLFDPSLPEARLQEMCRQAKAEIIVSAEHHRDLGARLTAKVLVLGFHTFSEPKGESKSPVRSANPSWLMYVAFTSGTSGRPKGALISHRNLASALYYQKDSLKLTPESRSYDFSSYSFDVSICNVFATLSAGGCVCIPSEKDRKERLVESIASLRANTIDLTPSTARLLSPKLVPGIKTIIFGGEALHVKDIEPWWETVQIVSLYGPCECTPNSTFSDNATSPEELVHLGRGVGLATWIVDPEDHGQLVSVGHIGELLLEGPLVGQGYLNETAKTTASFIDAPVWLQNGAPNREGRQSRLYKTGDLVRYNSDGTLSFVGRKDTQVKIRGQRLELEEIENVLRSQANVREAVAVVQHNERQEASIVSFVTIDGHDAMLEDQLGNGESLQRTEAWEEQFDDDYVDLDNIQPNSIGRDFSGWTSMYDGSDIDKHEMNEWLDDTIDSIRNGNPPGHVLEIGTGSGMILLNLVDGLQSYVGLEPSQRGVQFITKAVKTVPELANKVTMYKASALDVGRLGKNTTPDLVVLNSVIQYFPSQTYLFKVVQELVELKGVKTIFFGDVRSHALRRECILAKALHIAGENATKDQVRAVMADIDRGETELLVDPAFFTGLISRLPERIAHVEILPKKMYATNELSSYRYAAVLHVKLPERPTVQIHHINYNQWIDFMEEGLNNRSLLELLRRDWASPTLAVSNIPHSKSNFERIVLRSLDTSSNETVESDKWLSTARDTAQHDRSLAAVDLYDLAAQVGCQVEVSWARQCSQHGGLDAIFHSIQASTRNTRTMFAFPNDHRGRGYSSLTSEPLRQQLKQKVQQQVSQTLRAKLPSYMIPQDVIVLEKMPLTANGKIDRRALAERIKDRNLKRTQDSKPASEAERQMKDLWGQILGIESSKIGVNDNFFNLGGDSIHVMKLVREAYTAGLKLSMLDIITQPELHNVVRRAQSIPTPV